MKKPILVVMAAGMGSRYGGLKQIDPVGSHGEIIMDYSLYDTRRAGFERMIFIIKHSIEKEFHEAIGARIANYMNVSYAYQDLEDLPEGYTVPEGREKPWAPSRTIFPSAYLVLHCARLPHQQTVGTSSITSAISISRLEPGNR